MTDSQIAEFCKALSDENRVKIIKMLTGGELCACKILEAFNITQPTLSHHMKLLTDCGLVSARKEGKWSYYSINCEKFSEFKTVISDISCAESKSGCCCSAK
ncbi:ArsR/SmtB family transcription factor [Treponema sp.]|uniref:ArsR/SmtB family transcription factor n=1 Tax=Treponema sp. TaxID=166 RepID=UPI003890EECF